MARPKSRKSFLEERIEAMETDLTDAKAGEGWSAVASLHRAIIAARKELDVELGKLETKGRKAPTTIAEQVVTLKRTCEKWPDVLLVAVVETYCARYKLDMPRPLRKVGAGAGG